MKRLISLVLFQLCFIPIASAQINPPKSIHYKEIKYDFLLNVLSNPEANLYGFICAGFHEGNTEFHDEITYSQDQETINQCKELYGEKYNEHTFHSIYMKVKASWNVFLEVLQYSEEEISLEMMPDRARIILAKGKKTNPELRHKLSIVPLYLEEY